MASAPPPCPPAPPPTQTLVSATWRVRTHVTAHGSSCKLVATTDHLNPNPETRNPKQAYLRQPQLPISERFLCAVGSSHAHNRKLLKEALDKKDLSITLKLFHEPWQPGAKPWVRTRSLSDKIGSPSVLAWPIAPRTSRKHRDLSKRMNNAVFALPLILPAPCTHTSPPTYAQTCLPGLGQARLQ